MKFFFQIFLFSTSILLSQEYYQFDKGYVSPKIEYESKRSVCFFHFRNTESTKTLDYLSSGIPSIISSSFRNLKYTFDENPLPIKIQHEYGIKPLKLDNNQVSDPRYIKLDIEIIKDTKPILKEEALNAGKSKNCFYIITGEFKQLSSDKLQTKIEVTESKLGTSSEYTYNTSIKRGFQELTELISEVKIKSFLIGSAEVHIQTIPEKDVFIYLDDELLGKSPIVKIPVLPGKHKILLIKEDYKRVEKDIIIAHSKDNQFTFSLEKHIMIGSISISTNPPEADIYIGNKYIGKSPIENIDLPFGQNRLRIYKEGYIEKYYGIEVKNSKKVVLNFKLTEGDTNNFYKYGNNVFLDYSNFDFGNFSLYGSLLFYGIYMYSGYRESNEKDRLNGKAIFNSLTFYQNLNQAVNNSSTYGNLFLSSLAYQQNMVNQVEDGTQIYRTAQNVSIGGFFSMLLLSGYFYSKGLNSESFEIGYRPSFFNQQGSEASLKYKINF